MVVVLASETRVMKWGANLGIRLPKEFAEQCNLKHKSFVKMDMRDGILRIIPVHKTRERIPLAEILKRARDILTIENIFQKSFSVFNCEQPQVARKSAFLFRA